MQGIFKDQVQTFQIAHPQLTGALKFNLILVLFPQNTHSSISPSRTGLLYRLMLVPHPNNIGKEIP